MPKKYKYINGKKMIVVNNYDIGTDIIPEEEQIVPDPLVTDVGKVLTVNQAGNPAWEDAPEELPAVTSEDAGDVLTVNASGEWEAAAPSGGGDGTVIATFSQDSITEEWSCDKTGAEINEALQKGIVYAKIDGYSNLIPMIYAYYDNSIDEDYQFNFELDTTGTNNNIFITPGMRCIIEMSPSLITVSLGDSDMAFLSYYYLDGTPSFPQTGDRTIPSLIDLSAYDDEHIIFIPGVTHITYSAYLLERDCTVLSAQRDSSGGIIIALAIISEFGAYVHRYEYNPTLKTLEYMDAGE